MAIQSQLEGNENVSSIFSQWVADNINHNANTLDGQGVLHLMGIIEYNINQGEFQDKPIKRIKHLFKSSQVAKHARIKINWYNFPLCYALSKVTF